MDVKDVIIFKKTGLCFKDIKYSEILQCIGDSIQFLNKNQSREINIKNHTLLLSLNITEEKLACEGLITMRVFRKLESEKNKEEIGTIRFSIHKNYAFLGCIQTIRDQCRVRYLSKQIFKTKILNILFRIFKQFLSNQLISDIICPTMKMRCYNICDANHLLRTNYDELFISLGGKLEKNRWRFNLK